MKDSKYSISKIFNSLAQELQKVSEEELTDISSGKARIKIDIINKSPASKKSISSNIDYERVKSEMNSIQTREEGIEYLNYHCKTKKELTSLARTIDVHVQKTDKVDQLKEKIIESTIGFKLRSAAIQNKSI
jgi:hypothetical protein